MNPYMKNSSKNDFYNQNKDNLDNLDTMDTFARRVLMSEICVRDTYETKLERKTNVSNVNTIF